MQSNRFRKIDALTEDCANDARPQRNEAVQNANQTAPAMIDYRKKGKTVTREDIAKALIGSLEGVSRRRAKALVDSVIEEICNAIERGENVKLHGFGNFVLRDKGQRRGHNPRTMAPVAITERRVVSFRASPRLKTKVNPG